MLARLRQSTFVANLARLSGGIAIAQVLIYASAPILTRIYSPAEYGVAAAFVAALSAVSFLGTFNYETAIPIADDEAEAFALIRLAALLLVLSSTVVLVVLLLPRDWLAALGLGAFLSAAGYSLYFLPVALLSVGLYQVSAQWAFRENAIKTLSTTRVKQALAQVISGVGLGLASAGAWGLVVSRVAGQSMGALSLLPRGVIGLRRPRRGALGAAAIKFRSFAIIATPRRYLGEFVLAVPVLFVTHQYGLTSAGYLSLATTTIQLPLNIIGDSVAGVYLAESARLRLTNARQIRRRSFALLGALVSVAVLVACVLALVGPAAFATVYGERWRRAGEIALPLMLAAGGRLVFKPLSNAFDIYQRQATYLGVTLVKAALLVGSLWLAASANVALETAVLLSSGAIFAGFLVQWLVADTILRREVKRRAA